MTRNFKLKVAAVLVALVVGTLAGCGGSALDPEVAARARAVDGYGAPVGSDGLNPDDGSTTGPDTPGGTSTDPGGTSTDPANPGGSGNNPQNPGGSGNEPPPAAAPQVSCAGFKNGPGITDSVVKIGNASDISGPVPGLFTAARQAVQAYVKYFNDSGARICGRKLELDLYDSRTDNGGDQAAYVKGCGADFAMVSSMSAFDSGGAKTASDCGIPDVRAIATTTERAACKTCYAAQPAGPTAFQKAVPNFLKRHGVSKAGMLYISIGASATNGEAQAKHGQGMGIDYVVKQPVDVAAFNYGPYVQSLKSKGAQSVQFIASSAQFARLAQAMAQANYKPKVYLLDPSAYNAEYTTAAGAAAKGTTVFLNFTPFEEAGRNPEMATYLRYLNQVSPGAKPTFFGLFAWSAARLFAQEATKLGGKLSRTTLIDALKKVDNWTSNGVHAPQHVGRKQIADCWRFIQWSGSAWVPVDGAKYHCEGLHTF